MIFKDWLPTPPLNQFVYFHRMRHFIIPNYLQINSKPYPVRPEHCMAFYPRGFEITELIMDKSMITRPRSVITGQFTNRINRLTTCSEFLMILVVFKPGALYK